MNKINLIKKSLSFLLICVSALSFSQSDNLYQKWVLEQTTECHTNSIVDDSKWNIEFQRNGLAEISFIKIKGGTEVKYSVDENIILINEETYNIDTLLDDSLILTYSLDETCVKLIFSSIKGIMNYQLENFVMYNDEPVYFANDFNHPYLLGHHDIEDYFRKAYYKRAVEKSPCDIKFIFIVTKDGNLEKERGNISCLKKSDKIIKKIFKGTENKWEPMLINNEPVNTFVEIKFSFKYNKVEFKNQLDNFPRLNNRFEMRNLIIKHKNGFP